MLKEQALCKTTLESGQGPQPQSSRGKFPQTAAATAAIAAAMIPAAPITAAAKQTQASKDKQKQATTANKL